MLLFSVCEAKKTLSYKYNLNAKGDLQFKIKTDKWRCLCEMLKKVLKLSFKSVEL